MPANSAMSIISCLNARLAENNANSKRRGESKAGWSPAASLGRNFEGESLLLNL